MVARKGSLETIQLLDHLPAAGPCAGAQRVCTLTPPAEKSADPG